jgi:Uma2 family endonuclease
MTSTINPRPVIDPVPRLFTVADVAALPSELPSGPALYELDDGRLIIMPPPGDIHGAVETKFASAFFYEGERRGLGKTRCGDVGIILRLNPDRLVGADVVFITTNSLPIRRSPEGYLLTIPELVVEVRSKNDTWPFLERKVADYLAAGVRVVWVADPEARTVTAYRPNTPPQVFTINDTLTVEDIIPGLQLRVQDAFQD